jgi:ZIP family zinc transporter
MTEPTTLLVFIAALITALATGLGALPLMALREVTARSLAIGNALAAGLMLAASHSLIVEGFAFDPLRTLIGVLIGLAGVWIAKHFLSGPSGGVPNEVHGARSHSDTLKVLVIIGVMTAHSAAEGIGVGVSFGSGRELGDFITLAIALHNIPEGLAIALVMVPRGTRVGKAAIWAIFTSLPQPLLAVPAFLFVLAFTPWLPVGLGLAAGAMLWMIFSELLPEAKDGLSPSGIGLVVVASFVAMLAITLVLN